MSNPTLILGSRSTYRRALLARLGLEFECEPSGVDEDLAKSQWPDPRELALELARQKAEVVRRRFPGAFVIGSDQVGALGDERLDQPGTVERAIEQLRSLSGRTHELHAAVAIRGPDFAEEFLVTARLTMRSLDRGEIERVVERDQPLDCSGAYKLEGLGIALFERIECEDHTAIEGLPLLHTAAVLRRAGFAVP